GRIVNREEHVQQLVERHDGGIECDLHDLGMAGGAGAHVLVRRVGHVAPRVAGLDLLDALQLLERRFEAPEAAAGEGCDFALRHRVFSWWGYLKANGIRHAAPGPPARCRPRASGSWRMPCPDPWRCRPRRVRNRNRRSSPTGRAGGTPPPPAR